MTPIVHVTSSRKNGPSAQKVVIRAIIVRRDALLCINPGRAIHGSKMTSNKNTNGATVKANDCLSVSMI